MINLDKNRQSDNIAAINETINFYSSNLQEVRIEIEKIDNIFNQCQKDVGKIDENKNRAYLDSKKGLYLTTLCFIANLDATIALKHLLVAETSWEVIAAYKKICLVVYETLRTFDKHFNPWLKKELQATELFEEYKHFQTSKNDFRNKYGEEVRDVRLHSEAHIEDDYVKYYDSILLLKNIDCNELTFEFISLVNNLLNLNSKAAKISNQAAFVKIIMTQDTINTKMENIVNNPKIPDDIKERLYEWKERLNSIITGNIQQTPPTTQFTE